MIYIKDRFLGMLLPKAVAASIWFALIQCRVRIEFSAMDFEAGGRKNGENRLIKTDMRGDFNCDPRVGGFEFRQPPQFCFLCPSSPRIRAFFIFTQNHLL